MCAAFLSKLLQPVAETLARTGTLDNGSLTLQSQSLILSRSLHPGPTHPETLNQKLLTPKTLEDPRPVLLRGLLKPNFLLRRSWPALARVIHRLSLRGFALCQARGVNGLGFRGLGFRV